MDAIVPQLSDADMRDLATFFASLQPCASTSRSDPVKAIRGEKKAESTPCAACHPGRANRGIRESPRTQRQHHEYMVKQLQDFRTGRRTNDSGVMRQIAQSLTVTDIDDLDNYFAGIR